MQYSLAAAFVPSIKSVHRPKHVVKMGYEDELGVLPPVGFFDPLGNLLKNISSFLTDSFRIIKICHS